MLANSTIKSHIKLSSSGEGGILDKFIELLSKYKIKFTLINGIPLFAVANLASAKGLNTKDFAKNFIKNGKCILGGKFKKLEGAELIVFKTAWEKDKNTPFTRARSLWVCDWKGAYHYLSLGNSTQSKELKNIAADSIESVVTKSINSNNNTSPSVSTTKSNVVPINIKEEKTQEAICLLASYGNRHFKREQLIHNKLADGVNNTARTRRFDLVETKGRYLTVYEIKKDTLTADHIKEVIGDKGYLELATNRYSTKRVKLVFIAERITAAALRLLKECSKVEFISLGSLVSSLVEEIKEEITKESKDGEWYLYKRILPQFEGVLPLPPKLIKAA